MRDSKITFRVSDDLLERVDSIDESRSEIMREALRDYLDSNGTPSETDRREHRTTDEVSIDELISRRINEAVEAKLEDRNFNVNINLPESYQGERPSVTRSDPNEAKPVEVPDSEAEAKKCAECGEELDDSHVYCPNCGTKVSHRLFCECGDEIRSDWRFCPSCGRRTSTGHALKEQ
ncbi:MAG: zinc-ribbon domain-containing protein [Halobacteria archaeon]|nr:zinc-ribbon domain-containing protein [Halobacteria archaeon]